MRYAALTLLFVASGYAANAQFTLTPNAGFDNPLTQIRYNDGSFFTPLEGQASVRAGLRLDYKLKTGHGPFIGISTARPVVNYSFSDAETGMNLYEASAGKVQLKVEGGWMLSPKPIWFNKTSAAGKTAASPARTTTIKQYTYSRTQKSGCGQKQETVKKSCGTYSVQKSQCGQKKQSIARKAPDKSWYMSIQPLAGINFTPSAMDDVEEDGAKKIYRAGNNRTAFFAGSNFEFGTRRARHFTLNLQYFRALGDNKATVMTQDGAKTTIANLASRSSGWSASIGIPISLSKKPVAKKQVVEKKVIRKTDCRQIKINCERKIQ